MYHDIDANLRKTTLLSLSSDAIFHYVFWSSADYMLFSCPRRCIFNKSSKLFIDVIIIEHSRHFLTLDLIDDFKDDRYVVWFGEEKKY